MADFLTFSLRTKQALLVINKRSNKLYNSLKVKQIQCLRKIYENNDVIACLPTGYGKSLVYDILPYFCNPNDSIVVIISPLRVIVSAVLSRHAELAYEVMKGSVSDARFIEGDFRYLVGFPEAFLDKCVCNVMKTWQHRVCWVTIDEAHCILQWGSSFRPDYGNVVKLRTIFLSAHVLALTATATIKAVHQLCQQLALKVIMCCSFTYSIIVVIMLNNC